MPSGAPAFRAVVQQVFHLGVVRVHVVAEHDHAVALAQGGHQVAPAPGVSMRLRQLASRDLGGGLVVNLGPPVPACCQRHGRGRRAPVAGWRSAPTNLSRRPVPATWPAARRAATCHWCGTARRDRCMGGLQRRRSRRHRRERRTTAWQPASVRRVGERFSRRSHRLVGDGYNTRQGIWLTLSDARSCPNSNDKGLRRRAARFWPSPRPATSASSCSCHRGNLASALRKKTHLGAVQLHHVVRLSPERAPVPWTKITGLSGSVPQPSSFSGR